MTDTKKAMFKELKGTANRQGVETYARSFGSMGIAGRAINQLFGLAVKDPAAKAVVGTLTALGGPLVHSEAAKAAGRDETETQLKNPGDKAMRHNAVGKAFRPFTLGLGVGNSVVSAPFIAGRYGLDKAEDADGAGRQDAGKQGVTFAENLMLAIPGTISAMHTIRHVYAEQAAAEFSLQQPLEDPRGDNVGTITTHHGPRESDDGDGPELGRIKLDHDGTRHTVSIRDAGDGRVELKREGEERTPEAAPTDLRTRAANVMTGSASALKTSVKNAFAGGQDTMKVASMASNIALAQVINRFAGPAIEATLLANKVPEAAVTAVKAAASTAITNGALALFLGSFQTAFAPVPHRPPDTQDASVPEAPREAEGTSAPDLERGAASGSGVVNEQTAEGTEDAPQPRQTMREWAESIGQGGGEGLANFIQNLLPTFLPVVGTVAGWARDQIDFNTPQLKEDTFAAYAEQKVNMLSGLANLDSRLVEREGDGVKVDTDVLAELIQNLPAPRENS